MISFFSKASQPCMRRFAGAICSKRISLVKQQSASPSSSMLMNPLIVNSMPNPIALSPSRGMSRYQGPMPSLKDNEFVIVTPEVSGPGGMTVPAELGEVCELSLKVGDTVNEDAVVAVIDTCKASVEARCRGSGVVTRVLANVGDMVFELQPLYVIEQRR
mmetsp:Transcript_59333/g.157912  ORF Transcript_59333/g.157912 Transcript_59333/m.157912 type:complete len:160 (+) Transcript_59333:76-555(+)